MEYKIPTALRSDRFTLNSLPIDITKIGDSFAYPTIKLSQGAVCLLGSPYTGNILDAVILTNYTNHPLTLIDRDNRARTIEPVCLSHPGEFDFIDAVVIERIIVKQETFNAKPDSAFHKYAKLNPLRRRANVKAFYDSYNVDGRPEDYHFLDQAIIHNVDSLLKSHDGGFYIETMGYVVTQPDTANVTYIHPQTDSITKMELCPSASNESSAFFELFLNDTDHLYEKAFTNLTGVVIEIPIQRNSQLPNGIHYVTGNLDQYRNRSKSTYHYGFDNEDCPIKIFSSKVDAATLGNADTIAEKEILRLKHENSLAKERLEVLKNENVEKTIENTRLSVEDRKEELASKVSERDRSERVAAATYVREMHEQKVKSDQARIARERVAVEAERTAKIETTSFWRKMAAESVKVVAAAVSVVATVFAWIKLRGA